MQIRQIIPFGSNNEYEKGKKAEYKREYTIAIAYQDVNAKTAQNSYTIQKFNFVLTPGTYDAKKLFEVYE